MAYNRKTVDLYLSDAFVSILDRFRSSSSIAELFLKRNYKEDILEDYVDYISICETDINKISYLTKDRIAKLGNEDPWTTSKRYSARPGALAGKIFRNLPAKEVENFNNQYRATIMRNDFKFEVVSGKDITKYYFAGSYAAEKGSLGASCMKYQNCQGYFDIYTTNSAVKMLVMLDEDDKLMGRALLWDFDGNKVMDRIYTTNDMELPYHFKAWANKNEYIYKKEQKWNNTIQFESHGKRIDHKFGIKLENVEFERYPYIDTFKFLDKSNKMLYNYIPDVENAKNKIFTAIAPDGRIFNGDVLGLDFITNLFQHRGETIPVQYRDGEFISSEEYRTHESNVRWSRVNEMYILRTDALYVEELGGDYIFDKKLDNLNKHESIEKVKQQIREKEDRRQRELKELEDRRQREREILMHRQRQREAEMARQYEQETQRREAARLERDQNPDMVENENDAFLRELAQYERYYNNQYEMGDMLERNLRNRMDRGETRERAGDRRVYDWFNPFRNRAQPTETATVVTAATANTQAPMYLTYTDGTAMGVTGSTTNNITFNVSFDTDGVF